MRVEDRTDEAGDEEGESLEIAGHLGFADLQFSSVNYFPSNLSKNNQPLGQAHYNNQTTSQIHIRENAQIKHFVSNKNLTTTAIAWL